jgi:hypothetical protein
VFTLNEDDKIPTVLLGRRSFVAGSVALGVILAWWRFTERNRPLHAEVESAGLPKSVTIIEFTDAGQRISTVTVDRIVKTEAEWKKQLSPDSFEVTRHAATERPYTKIRTRTKRVSSAASVVTPPCLTPTPSSTPAPDGPVSGRR